MSTLNIASSVISSLVESTKLPINYVENGASLWVLSAKDLIAKTRKQGSGTTLVTKGGYITTRQNKEEIVSLPFMQSMEVATFGCKVKEGKPSASYSTVTWKQDGHEYPYNTKLQFSVKMCQEICLAALGEAGLSSLFASQLEDQPNATPVNLLKEITKPAIWWNKLQRVLLGSDIQIQLLVVVDATKIQNKVVSKVYGTDNYAFDFDVTEHVVGFQVVSTSSPQYIWGLGLPTQVVQVVEAAEEQKVTFYKSVEEIPLNAKNAQNQLTKFYVSYMNEHPEFHADQEAGRVKFLTEGIKAGKLANWLAAEGNLDKATVWLAKKNYTPAKVTKASELESKPAEIRQAERAGSVLGEVTVINPIAEETKPSVEEKATKLAGVFSSNDDEDDNWEINS